MDIEIWTTRVCGKYSLGGNCNRLSQRCKASKILGPSTLESVFFFKKKKKKKPLQRSTYFSSQKWKKKCPSSEPIWEKNKHEHIHKHLFLIINGVKKKKKNWKIDCNIKEKKKKWFKKTKNIFDDVFFFFFPNSLSPLKYF